MRAAAAMFSLTRRCTAAAVSTSVQSNADARGLQSAFGRGDIQRHRPAQKIIRIEITKNEIGIGHRRQRAAETVAGWPGAGSGALRADLQQAQFVDPGDAAAAGAAFQYVNCGKLQGITAALAETMYAGRLQAGSDRRLSIVNQADFGGRASHIE